MTDSGVIDDQDIKACEKKLTVAEAEAQTPPRPFRPRPMPQPPEYIDELDADGNLVSRKEPEPQGLIAALTRQNGDDTGVLTPPSLGQIHDALSIGTSHDFPKHLVAGDGSTIDVLTIEPSTQDLKLLDEMSIKSLLKRERSTRELAAQIRRDEIAKVIKIVETNLRIDKALAVHGSVVAEMSQNLRDAVRGAFISGEAHCALNPPHGTPRMFEIAFQRPVTTEISPNLFALIWSETSHATADANRPVVQFWTESEGNYIDAAKHAAKVVDRSAAAGYPQGLPRTLSISDVLK